MSLKGKVCLVTGATRGIGKGIALQLGQAGATVYITGKRRGGRGDGFHPRDREGYSAAAGTGGSHGVHNR